MRIFIDDILYFGILDIFEVLQCLFICLFRQVVHHNHLEIMFLIGKTNQISYSAMRLHNQIHQLLVY